MDEQYCQKGNYSRVILSLKNPFITCEDENLNMTPKKFPPESYVQEGLKFRCVVQTKFSPGL